MGDKKDIGVLASSLSSVFVKQALEGLERGLQGSGHALRLIEVDLDEAIHANRMIEDLANASSVAALMYVHMPLNVRQIALFKDAGIPVAYLAGRMEGIDWCMVDELKGAYEATRHLVGMGHKRIALISGPLVALESRLREDGFLRALKENGVQFGRERDIKILNFSEGEGYEAIRLLMNLPDRPTAIFVSAGDLTALGVLEALDDFGLKVPQDVSVVGFDDLDFAATLDPPLTTVRQPLAQMGEMLMHRLLDAVENPDSHKSGGEVLEPELVIRKSTAEAKE
jgi:DNA-binding LacI/PurR family transcriptional regulator